MTKPHKKTSKTKARTPGSSKHALFKIIDTLRDEINSKKAAREQTRQEVERFLSEMVGEIVDDIIDELHDQACNLARARAARLGLGSSPRAHAYFRRLA